MGDKRLFLLPSVVEAEQEFNRLHKYYGESLRVRKVDMKKLILTLTNGQEYLFLVTPVKVDLQALRGRNAGSVHFDALLNELKRTVMAAIGAEVK